MHLYMFQGHAFSFTSSPLLCRGRILVQAGEKEDIVYADIGEWGTGLKMHMLYCQSLLMVGNWIYSSALLFLLSYPPPPCADVGEADSIRQQIPVQSQKRTDVYSVQMTQTQQ